jgi:bifunctional DNase/RNase
MGPLVSAELIVTDTFSQHRDLQTVVTTKVCGQPGCVQKAVACCAYIKQRRLSEEVWYCAEHGRASIQQYWARKNELDASMAQIKDSRGISFDVQLIYFEQTQHDGFSRHEIHLCEIEGSFRLPLQTGPFEVAAMYRALGKVQGPRPATHHAIAAIITNLGGRLNCVTIDHYSITERIYKAKVHVQQDNRIIEIDIRPSDAVILAVIGKAPIIVSPDVLMKFWEQSPEK